MTAVKLLYDLVGKRRVRIIRRDDGAFVISAEHWWQEYWEGRLMWQGWEPLRRNVSLFASAELAEQEARRDYAWIES